MKMLAASISCIAVLLAGSAHGQSVLTFMPSTLHPAADPPVRPLVAPGSPLNSWSTAAVVSYHFQDGDFFDGMSIEGMLSRELFSRKPDEWGFHFQSTLTNPKSGNADKLSMSETLKNVASGDRGLSFGFNPYYVLARGRDAYLVASSKLECVYHYAASDSTDSYLPEGAMTGGLEGHFKALTEEAVLGFEYRFGWYDSKFKEFFQRTDSNLSVMRLYCNFTVPELSFGGATGFQFVANFCEDSKPSFRMGFLVKPKAKS